MQDVSGVKYTEAFSFVQTDAQYIISIEVAIKPAEYVRTGLLGEIPGVK